MKLTLAFALLSSFAIACASGGANATGTSSDSMSSATGSAADTDASTVSDSTVAPNDAKAGDGDAASTTKKIPKFTEPPPKPKAGPALGAGQNNSNTSQRSDR